MQTTRTTIEEQVMASVGLIYLGRRLVGLTTLKVYAFLVAAYALVQLTWVHKVIENFFIVERGGLGSIATYLLVAVEHTHLAVQITLVVLAVLGLSLLRDMIRSFTRTNLRTV